MTDLFAVRQAVLRKELAALKHDCLAFGRVLAAARLALQLRYDPNQPRVPAGSPDGGQWTSGEGETGQPREMTQRRGAPPNTVAPAVQLAVARAEASAAIRNVQRYNPSWQPQTQSLTSGGTDGDIAALRARRDEAEAYLALLRARGIGPGPYAGDPADLPFGRETAAGRRQLNRSGDENGCHTCGTRSPGSTSGSWYWDHQNPTALNWSREPQVGYPQCRHCSDRQGGWVRSIRRENGF
jgi:hypothetical protein